VDDNDNAIIRKNTKATHLEGVEPGVTNSMGVSYDYFEHEWGQVSKTGVT
jgi:hypothetical protein